ncbi:hypothetical protein [Nitrosopumilus sp.]
MSQNGPFSDVSQAPFEEKDDNCVCDKKQCLLGIGSIAIGLGGLVLALLL